MPSLTSAVGEARESLAAELKNAQSEVVSRVDGVPFTYQELTEFFNRAVDKRNWKNPIDAVVELHGDRELIGLREAIRFFTGSEASFLPLIGAKLPACRYRVRAAGYYEAVGS